MTRYAILTLLTLGLACGTDKPAPDPGPGRIIFTRVGNGFQDIYGMDTPVLGLHPAVGALSSIIGRSRPVL